MPLRSSSVVTEARTSSSLWLDSWPALCVHSPQFIRSVMDIDCFSLLTLVSNAAVNMEVQVSLWGRDLIFLGCTPRSGLDGSYYSSIFNFRRTRHSVFCSGRPNLHSDKECSREEWDGVGLAREVHEFTSVAQSCPSLCDPVDRSTPGFPVHHRLLELIQTHVHWVSDAIQPSHPLSSPSPPTCSLSQHQGLFQWVNSSHQVAKVLEFQLQHQSFQWIFRTVFL